MYFFENYGEANFSVPGEDVNIDLSVLTMDQYYVRANINDSLPNAAVYTRNDECYKCPYTRSHNSDQYEIYKGNLSFAIADYNHGEYLAESDEKIYCKIDSGHFGEFGVYRINVLNETTCNVEALKDPMNIYYPMVSVFLIYMFICGLAYFVSKCIFYYKKEAKESDTEGPKKERVMSLDTFRGISIVIMIFANFGAGGYEIIEHAHWNGLHVADLVFPWFMWIMGVCIPISLSSSFKRETTNKEIFKNVLLRSIKLFCLGIFLNSGSNLRYLRIMGVLQRFGICYFVITLICLYFMRRGTSEQKGYFEDILKLWKGWIIMLAILISYLLILFLVRQPGCQMGYLGPGGLHENRSHFDCIGGATGYIDRLILGNHVYQKPTIYKIYEAKPFDPEGLLGSLPSIIHVFLGVQAGVILLVYKNHLDRILRFLSWGVVCGLIGGCLCGFSKEEGLIPVNKNLWSISFVFVTSCSAFLLLTICYVLVDVKKWWSGKPFLFAGMNSILMYIGHSMTDGHFPVRWYMETEGTLTYSMRGTHFLALLSDTWATGVWILVAYYLYKIKYFFTL